MSGGHADRDVYTALWACALATACVYAIAKSVSTSIRSIPLVPYELQSLLQEPPTEGAFATRARGISARRLQLDKGGAALLFAVLWLTAQYGVSYAVTGNSEDLARCMVPLQLLSLYAVVHASTGVAVTIGGLLMAISAGLAQALVTDADGRRWLVWPALGCAALGAGLLVSSFPGPDVDAKGEVCGSGARLSRRAGMILQNMHPGAHELSNTVRCRSMWTLDGEHIASIGIWDAALLAGVLLVAVGVYSLEFVYGIGEHWRISLVPVVGLFAVTAVVSACRLPRARGYGRRARASLAAVSALIAMLGATMVVHLYGGMGSSRIAQAVVLSAALFLAVVLAGGIYLAMRDRVRPFVMQMCTVSYEADGRMHRAFEITSCMDAHGGVREYGSATHHSA